MNQEQQEKIVDMFRIVDIQRKYKETYGKDWQQVYREDKENNCLMKVD